MTIADLERALASAAAIGTPDYADDAMLQYLRTERIVPPYQTRGYKLVELVRIYEVGISYYGRTYEEGKKIGWKDGVKAFLCILRYSLKTPRSTYKPAEQMPTQPARDNALDHG